ncbi:MAG: response regulator transcription factor [Candidatus Hodarchaeales archaeon]
MKTILVVDDEESSVKLVQFLFEDEGYRVLTANSGEETIDLLEKNDEKPDLILLDIIMPKLDGLEVCKWIKSQPHLKNIPVILFTVKADESDKIAGLNAGADAYITKPFKVDALLSLIESHINREMTH